MNSVDCCSPHMCHGSRSRDQMKQQVAGQNSNGLRTGLHACNPSPPEEAEAGGLWVQI